MTDTVYLIIVNNQWRPGIGDPTVIGWVTVAAYAAATVLCLRRAKSERGENHRKSAVTVVWIGLAVLLGLLGVNKQLDLQSWITVTGRQLAKSQGWYDSRQTVQVVGIIVLGIATAGSAVGLRVLLRGCWRETCDAVVGFVLLGAFVLIRASSFHHVDTLLGLNLSGFYVNHVLELSAIGWIIVSAMKRQRRSSAEQTKVRLPRTTKRRVGQEAVVRQLVRQKISEPSERTAQLALAIVRARLPLLVVAALVCGVFSYWYASRCSNRTAQGQIILACHDIQQPLGIDVDTRPDPAMIMVRVTSHDILQRLKDGRNWDIPLPVLKHVFVVTRVRYSDQIQIEYSASSPQDVIDVLNDLAILLIDDVYHERCQRLSQRRQYYDEQVRKSHETLAAIREDIASVYAQLERTNQGDTALVQGAIESMRGRLQEVKNAREMVLATRTANVELRDRCIREAQELASELKAHIVSGRRSQLRIASDSYAAGSTADIELHATAARLQELELSEVDYQQVGRWKTRVLSVGRELLGDLPAATQTTIDAVENQLEEIVSQIRQQDFVIVPLDQSVAMYDRQLASYNSALDSTRTLDEAPDSETVQQLEREAESVAGDLNLLQARILGVDRLLNYDGRELTVFSPPLREDISEDSNRKKLFVYGMAICGPLLCGSILVFGYYQIGMDPIVRAVHRWDLPVLAIGMLAQDDVPAVDGVRHLALRIQQCLAGRNAAAQHQLPAVSHTAATADPDSSESAKLWCRSFDATDRRAPTGRLVLFTAMSHGKSPLPIMSSLATCLARRGNRTLLITTSTSRCDCAVPTDVPIARSLQMPGATAVRERGSTTQVMPPDTPPTSLAVASCGCLPNASPDRPRLPGVSDYLLGDITDFTGLLGATAEERVFFLGPGRETLPEEAMASAAMTRLLDECRRTFDIVLIDGPSTDSSVDLQILAARADGIIVTLVRGSMKSNSSCAAIDELTELGAPMLGVIS